MLPRKQHARALWSISMSLGASRDDAACALAFEKMGLDASLRACDVTASCFTASRGEHSRGIRQARVQS